MPDPNEFASLLDLLSLAFLGIASNALDFKTYQYPDKHLDDPLSPEEFSLMTAYDLNSMERTERTLCMYVRGLSWEILTWLRTHYAVKYPDGRCLNMHSFSSEYFTDTAAIILRNLPPQNQASGFTYERLQSQLSFIFLSLSTKIRRRVSSNTLRDTISPDLAVVQLGVPFAPLAHVTIPQLIRRGKSEGDSRYEQGVKSNFSLPLVGKQSSPHSSKVLLKNTGTQVSDMKTATQKRKRT